MGFEKKTNVKPEYDYSKNNNSSKIIVNNILNVLNMPLFKYN